VGDVRAGFFTSKNFSTSASSERTVSAFAAKISSPKCREIGWPAARPASGSMSAASTRPTICSLCLGSNVSLVIRASMTPLERISKNRRRSRVNAGTST